MPIAPGARLGPYEILTPLGAGGMGEVYRARDPRLGRDVALESWRVRCRRFGAARGHLDSATIAAVNAPAPKRFERYVALGDSSTEGVDDPDETGGYRGWSRRLAQRIADAQGSVQYANFGVRGRTTREILRQQLAPALALRPDLATVFSGTNDVVRPRFHAREVERDVEEMQRALIAQGATVLTFTLPDLAPVMPMARGLSPRIRALNQGLRDASARTGAILLDFATCPLGADARIWSGDRIHANAVGHARIAHALAHALGLPDADDSWSLPLPPVAAPTGWAWLAAEWQWTRRYLLPWIGRGLHRRAASPARPRGTPVLQRLERMSSP